MKFLAREYAVGSFLTAMGFVAGCTDATQVTSAPKIEAELQQTSGQQRSNKEAERLTPEAPTRQALTQPKIGTLCQKICSSAKALGCSAADECLSICEQMRMTTVCARELDLFMRCMASQAVSEWSCTEEGTAMLKEGVCDSEQGGFAACAMAANQ